MLNTLKKHATGWIAQLFIGLLVLSFALWGVSGFFTGYQADVVATVGNTEISAQEFARQYDQTLQGMTRQTGRPLTAEQAQLFGLPGQVLGRLVTQATLDDTARQYGLGISNEVLAQKIAEDPAFRGPSGGFERIYFQQVLRNAGFTEDQYIADRHNVFLRYQISDALVGGAQAPTPYLEALHEFRTEARDISYLVLTSAAAGTVGTPSDTQLNEYFEANRTQWRAPEYRALSLFLVTPEDIAKPEEITDDDARAHYDANIGDFTKLERREVSQIHYDTQADAEAAAAELAAGKTFDDLAAARNLTAADTSLGLVTRDQIIDEKIAEAAFALESGTTSGAVESNFGWVIVRVTDVQPGETSPFEDVKDEIKQEMAVDLANRRIIQTYDEVEDSRAAGDTLAEIAASIGVPLRTIAAVDRSGNDAAGAGIADLPGGSDLLAAAFETDVGIENDAVRTADNGYVWYEVTAITAERDRQLDEVRDQVVAAWKNAETEKRLVEIAEDIRSRLAGGETIEEVAGDLGFAVRTATGLTRSAQPPAGLSPSVIAAAFGGPVGHVAVADGAPDTGSRIVLVVAGSTVPPFNPNAPELAQVRKTISDQIANDYLQQFLVEMRDGLGTWVNQTTLEAVVGQQRSGF